MDDPGNSELVKPPEQSKPPGLLLSGTKIFMPLALATTFIMMGMSCAVFIGSLGPFKMPLAGIAFIMAALSFHLLLRRKSGAAADSTAELSGLIKAGAGGIFLMGTLFSGITGVMYFLMSPANPVFTTMGGFCGALFAVQSLLLFLIYRSDFGTKPK